ncbi:YlbD family protein [Pontibacillus salicampi]|uniref:YlbD family protein n=1 Tax=Pontibacillus salicampi TaxID=1449801 RepID=A0ABV6LNU9_9BACI
MASKSLHPTVQEFKDFALKHPKLVETVKKNGESWQGYYEKWVLLGEEDSFWDAYKDNATESNKASSNEDDNKDKETNEEDNSKFMGQLMGMIENVDLNKVQGHINQLNGAIANIQTLVGQFQDMKKSGDTSAAKTNETRRSPFQFGRD